MNTPSEFSIDVREQLGMQFSAKAIHQVLGSAVSKKRFATELSNAVRDLLQKPFATFCDSTIMVLNELDHELTLNSGDAEEELCLKYYRFSKDKSALQLQEFLVAFDLQAFVFYADDEATSSLTYPSEQVATPDDYKILGRSSFEKLRSDPDSLALWCSDLQHCLEVDLCRSLRPKLSEIAGRLNEIGHEMQNRNSAIPECDYRDCSSRLHVGIYCIVTVAHSENSNHKEQQVEGN